MADLMNDDPIVRFRAAVAQVRTMADGGLRLVLDLSENDIDTAYKMMQAKKAGAILEIALVALDPKKMPSNENLFDLSDVDFLGL